MPRMEEKFDVIVVGRRPLRLRGGDWLKRKSIIYQTSQT